MGRLVHLLTPGFIIAAAGLAVSQVEQKPFLEEERQREMEARKRAQEELYQPFLWDAGGWAHFEFVRLEDKPDQDTRTLRYWDLRLWGQVKIDRRYTAYLRTQSYVADWNEGDQFEGSDGNRGDPIHVDQAWVDADWSSPDMGFNVRLGRQYLMLGRGLLFNGLAYAAQAQLESMHGTLKAFGAHSIIHEDDIDTSMTTADDSHRAFVGAEAGWLAILGSRAYVMALIERDLNDEDPEIAAQDWEYNAEYLGLGARGPIWSGLGYAVEAVYQSGESVAAGSNEREDIRAWALAATLDAAIAAPTSPYVVLEYLFGSGDPDRGSVTDQLSGNKAGTDDEAFLAFGFVQTGFSLFPRLSNIHILRLGGTIRPLESVDAVKSLEIGAFGYLYRKDESSAPISDPRSTQDDPDVGKEIDFLIRWRVTSDVGFSVNYGRFIPGDAYTEDDPRDFVSMGLTYSF